MSGGTQGAVVPPPVDVVVLNWNGWRDTLACIDDLRRLDDSNHRLVVIDNGSSDDSLVRIQAAAPDVALIQSPTNLGFGGGCNLGLRQALDRGAEFVWLLNNDCRVDPGALTCLLRTARSDPRIAAVGSLILEADPPERVQVWGGGRVQLWLGRSQHQRRPGPLDFVSGASLLLRVQALREVGLFDQEAFFMYWEDTDLGLRLCRAGWRLAVAEGARVWHRQSASLGRGSPALVFHHTRSGVRFLRKQAPVPGVSVAAMLSLMLAKRLLLIDVAGARAVIRGYLQA